MSPPMSGLPIDALREPLRQARARGIPLVLTAPTGTGKSTRVPGFLLDDGPGPVLVVEPRRVACRALAERVAQERGGAVGDEVGYAVRFEERRSARTTLLFVTPGVALRMIASGDLEAWSTLVLDEFHERSWQLDLLAAATLGQTTCVPVFISATLGGEALAEKVGGAHLSVEARTYPVAVSWEDAPAEPSLRDLDTRVAATVTQVLKEEGEQGGDVLVFLPGRGEIRAAHRALAHLPGDVRVQELHGSLPLAILAEALTERCDKRRVTLATNLAETSLTLPSVTTVIDSGLERRVIHRAGRNVLAVVPISRASMDQRAGRAGRVRPGRAIRLFAPRYLPREEIPPEVEGIGLDAFVAHAALCGIEGDAFDHAPWITPPPGFAVTEARKRLGRGGFLTADHHLTPLGREALSIPVDLEEALALLEAPEHLRSGLLDLVAVLQWRQCPLLPLPKNDERAEDVREARIELARNAPHEPAWWVALLRHGHPRKHAVDAAPLKEARRLASDLRARLEMDEDTTLPIDWNALGTWLAELWPQSVFVRRARADRRRERGSHAEPWTNGEIEVEVEPFAQVDPERQVRAPQAGLLLRTSWTGRMGPGTHGRGGLLLPLSLRQLAEAGCGTLHRGTPRWERGAPMATTERRIAEVVLDSFEERLVGKEALQAMAALILEGRLLSGAHDLLEEDWHLLQIALKTPENDRPTWTQAPTGSPPEHLLTWLEVTLDRLGVTQGEDLALLEVDDLRLPLSALTGWSPDDLERLRATFPRGWSHLGQHHHVDVDPVRRSVTLVACDRASRRRGPPEANVVPRFSGYRVAWSDGQKSIRVR